MPKSLHMGLPIVIGGCHRTGTSLVRRILDSHSRIHCGPEVKFFADMYSVPTWALSFLWTARTLVDTDELLEVLGAGFVELHERAARAAGKSRWADKAPENAIYCQQWERLLEDRWLFVHVLRNPLDTMASIAEAKFFNLPAELTERAQHYRNYVEGGLRFGAEHPERYHEILYEEMVTRPTVTLERLMEFLGEELEPNQLAFNDRPHRVGVEDPKIAATTEVHRGSLHRWPSVLPASDAETVWDLTADLWTRVDPARRFVEPPAEPLIGIDSPPADRRARRSSTH